MGNRTRLKAWREAHDPEYQERLERAKREGRSHDPVTGRPRKFSKYLNRKLLVMTGGDQHTPVLEWLWYDDIAKRNRNNHWLSGPMTRKFGLNPKLPQTCWYTGVQMYLVPWDLFESLGRQVPWMCSKEHLVCERNGNAQRQSNIVLAGRYINKKLGHSPLPLKLMHRQRFLKMEVDRETPTWVNVDPWVQAILDFESQYKLGAHFPWQPWAFDVGTSERRTADAFHADMLKEERTFAELDDAGRTQWLQESTWRW